MTPFEQPSLWREKCGAAAEALAGRSFLSVRDLGPKGLGPFLDFAAALKRGDYADLRPLAGKTVPLVFFNPSLRTRASMATAVYELGGHPLVLDVGQGVWSMEWRDDVVMNESATEHLKEAVPVLARYGAILGVRAFPLMQSLEEDMLDPVVGAFRKLAGKPVVNLESAVEHPCQSLADLLTIKETKGGLAGRNVVLTWANHPKALPLSVPHSFALATAMAGCDLTIAAPPGYRLPEPLMDGVMSAAAAGGGSVRQTESMEEALPGAEVIYAKSWGNPDFYGDPAAEARARADLSDWIVTEDKMAKTAGASFLHCLPVRRGVVVTSGVLDGPSSVVIQEAENRLHVQKALLTLIAGGLS